MNSATVAKKEDNRSKRKRQIDCEYAIIGAGFGGMGIGIQLKRMNITDFRIIERGSDVGGTWHWNTYPGLAVDIPSTTYSFSFEPNPNWSRVFAPGPELKRYALDIAEKYKLRSYVQFNTSVEKVVFNEEEATWTIYTDNGEPITARFLIMATGYLSQPKFPDIKGLEDFEGKTMHTQLWDHEHDLTGKRAAVIGTGATSVQLIPEIAQQLEQMDVYQRTPIWVAPKFDGFVPKVIKRTFKTLPFTQRLARIATTSVMELGLVTAGLHAERFPGLTRQAEKMCKAHLKREIPDEKMRDKLTPKYSFGCKRPTASNSYYSTFLRDNVELVTNGISHIEPDGIVTKDGVKRKIDTLILATGFKVWEKGNFPAFEVVGRNNVELGTHWDQNQYESYEGISVNGYPNMLYLASPYGFTGLSYFFTIEGQMMHLERLINAMRKNKSKTFEVVKSAQDKYVTTMKQNMKGTVIEVGNCSLANTYYLNQHGESTLLRASPTPVALWKTSHFPLKDYSFG